MEVLLLIVLCLIVSACELSQISNPQLNEVASVQMQFHHKDEIQHRRKRKIINHHFYPTRKWPVEIEFYLEDTFSAVQKNLLRSVITGDFGANTCLQFTELISTDNARNHFMFFKENSENINLCRADYIGRNYDTKTLPGHPLYLGTNCFNYKGTLVQTIAETLGMYNEVQRPDRDSYVDLELDNIATAHKDLFTKQSDDVIDSHGTPYDYGSAVHYSADAWLKDTLKNSHWEPSVGDNLSYTVRPKDPKLFRLLGQKSELSFYDIQVINRAYCADTCDKKVYCSSGGYQDPNDCDKCKCPDGYAGDHCEDFAENVAHPRQQCTPLSDTITVTDEKTCVMSPGYELNQPYSTGDKCTWVLESPAGTYIDMWFSEDRFALAYASRAHAFCLHWVEIKYKGLDSPRGPRYCTLDLILTNPTLPTKSAPLISESNKVMVIFKSPQAHLQVEYKERDRHGFKLCFKISSVVPK